MSAFYHDGSDSIHPGATYHSFLKSSSSDQDLFHHHHNQPFHLGNLIDTNIEDTTDAMCSNHGINGSRLMGYEYESNDEATQRRESGLSTPIPYSSESSPREKSTSSSFEGITSMTHGYGGQLFCQNHDSGDKPRNKMASQDGLMGTLDSAAEHDDGNSNVVTYSSSDNSGAPTSTIFFPSTLSKPLEDDNPDQDKGSDDTGPPYTCKLGEWRCSYCGVTATECRRRGPPGYDKLCNRCGARWSRGTILPEFPKKYYPPGGEGGGRRRMMPEEVQEMERIKREEENQARSRLRRRSRRQSSLYLGGSTIDRITESEEVDELEDDEDGYRAFSGGIADRLKTRRGRRSKDYNSSSPEKACDAEVARVSHSKKKLKLEVTESQDQQYVRCESDYEDDADDELDEDDDEEKNDDEYRPPSKRSRKHSSNGRPKQHASSTIRGKSKDPSLRSDAVIQLNDFLALPVVTTTPQLQLSPPNQHLSPQNTLAPSEKSLSTSQQPQSYHQQMKQSAAWKHDHNLHQNSNLMLPWAATQPFATLPVLPFHHTNSGNGFFITGDNVIQPSCLPNTSISSLYHSSFSNNILPIIPSSTSNYSMAYNNLSLYPDTTITSSAHTSSLSANQQSSTPSSGIPRSTATTLPTTTIASGCIFKTSTQSSNLMLPSMHSPPIELPFNSNSYGNHQGNLPNENCNTSQGSTETPAQVQVANELFQERSARLNRALHGKMGAYVTSVLCEVLNISPLTLLSLSGTKEGGFEIDINKIDEIGWYKLNKAIDEIEMDD
ncbi:hypothetical protein SeMB42_g00241 [Synchytrium endobioticum]|uniref:GATA-type domain-containing protein n=1 Tax=Synchytrium endobioticum TaxID=286115 RepID=A0A507DTG7_9FUNG|nr:hypothetical protein SeMB42_g00241 [Synchytrium endobioticum]